MKPRNLKTTILGSFLIVIILLGFSIAILGYYVINKNIVESTQNQVDDALKAARSEYTGMIESLELLFNFIKPSDDLDRVRRKAGLDYLKIEYAPGENVYSDIVKKAMNGIKTGGIRLMEKEELEQMDADTREKAAMDIVFTLKSSPTDRKKLESAMVMEYAKPFYNDDGALAGVMCGGKLINRDFDLVDKIRDIVFVNEMYDHKPVGTVTIFQNDVRITTNVLNKDGQRALGTRVSKEVYDNVVEKGLTWVDRAFVVTDWYLTAYEPIKDINGKIIGILYVGMLEKPFTDMEKQSLIVFLIIILAGVVLAIIISFLLAGAIVKPVYEMLRATNKFSEGDLEHRMEPNTSISELNKLAASFNKMARKLNKSYKNIKSSNEQLSRLNKNYLDLISFVSHELKGILSSTIMNAYAVRDGFLGMVNFKQQKALDSIARNLDYLDSTVKNFLSLSRIEKSEMPVNKKFVKLKEDILDVSADAFNKQITEKKIEFIDEVPASEEIYADPDLMTVAFNNLISNAVKYGIVSGKIKVTSENIGENLRVSVYNDGKVIEQKDMDKLFKRFSRLDNARETREKGTGLGLFITRNIISVHGGRIWAEPAEKGNKFIFEINKGGASGESDTEDQKKEG